MKLLHIDSSILGAGSVTRELSAAVVKRLTAAGGVDVAYRDLAAAGLPHATAATLPGDHPLSAMAGELDATAQAVRDESQAILDEFLAADTIVIGVPMYNFGIASQLKAWIDRILVPGKTFAYGASGPVGLAADKRVILVISRGSAFGVPSVPSAAEHAESHLRTIFGFIGVADLDVVIADGVKASADGQATAVASAYRSLEALAA